MAMDLDDKPRRNLLIVSLAIIIYWWLDLPPRFVFNQVIKDAPDAIDGWRVWLVALLVLCYQIQRYWVIGIPGGLKEITAGFGKARDGLQHHEVESDVERYREGGTFKWCVEIDKNSRDEVVRGPSDPLPRSLHLGPYEVFERGFRREYEVQHSREGMNYANAPMVRVRYVAPRRKRWFINLLAFASAVFGKALSEYLVPLLGGLAAFSIALNRLIDSL